MACKTREKQEGNKRHYWTRVETKYRNDHKWYFSYCLYCSREAIGSTPGQLKSMKDKEDR